MKDKKQTIRFTDKELEIIKGSFAENDELIKSLRKHFLQMDLDAVDLSRIETFAKKKQDVLSVIKKSFYPELDSEAPLLQVVDLWMTVAISDKTVEEAIPHIEIRKRFIEYIKQQLDLLEGKEIKDIIRFSNLLDLGVSNFEDYVRISTRNFIINHVEQRLMELQVLAGMKDETAEQTMERLRKNSAK